MTPSEQETEDWSRAQEGHVHSFLRTAILFGGLAAGAAVTVGALALRHRVLARSARRALVRLEDEGLLARETDDSFVVRDSLG